MATCPGADAWSPQELEEAGEPSPGDSLEGAQSWDPLNCPGTPGPQTCGPQDCGRGWFPVDCSRPAWSPL